jgi:hypothetical protein
VVVAAVAGDGDGGWWLVVGGGRRCYMPFLDVLSSLEECLLGVHVYVGSVRFS